MFSNVLYDTRRRAVAARNHPVSLFIGYVFQPKEAKNMPN
jgi:hypothetical protein